MSTKKILVIYHRADFDGLFCREIARRQLGDTAEYLGWDYGDPRPTVAPEIEVILMLDISIKGMMGDPRLTWIDHHRTAMDEFVSVGRPSIKGYRIDGVAACRLAWQWFNCRTPSKLPVFEEYRDRVVCEPLAVRLAGEYDIWDKRDPRAELFQHGLRSCDLTPLWPRLMEDWEGGGGDALVAELLAHGEGIAYAKRHENESVIKSHGFTVQWEGLTFLACNAARYNSHLFTAGLRPEHDGCLGFGWAANKWRVSLYGVPGKPDIDLSAIAKKYGGGGHKQACGFGCAVLPFGQQGGRSLGLEISRPSGRVLGEVSKIEVSFPVSVTIPDDWYQKLDRLVDEVCIAYEAAHPDRVMWPAGAGSKLLWSQMDAAFLGRVPEHGAKLSGEPDSDDTVFEISVSEREAYPGERARGAALKSKFANGAELITAERERQRKSEKWTPEHDDGHDGGQMTAAAIAYAMTPAVRAVEIKDGQQLAEHGGPVAVNQTLLQFFWPWGPRWWKPTPEDRVRELVKAGALIAAEIDRLKRASAKTS